MYFEEIILTTEWRRDRGMGYRARQNMEPRNWERAIRRLLHLPGERVGLGWAVLAEEERRGQLKH